MWSLVLFDEPNEMVLSALAWALATTLAAFLESIDYEINSESFAFGSFICGNWFLSKFTDLVISAHCSFSSWDGAKILCYINFWVITWAFFLSAAWIIYSGSKWFWPLFTCTFYIWMLMFCWVLGSGFFIYRFKLKNSDFLAYLLSFVTISPSLLPRLYDMLGNACLF